MCLSFLSRITFFVTHIYRKENLFVDLVSEHALHVSSNVWWCPYFCLNALASAFMGDCASWFCN